MPRETPSWDDVVVTFYGHAGLGIAHRDTTVVADPWFSHHGAFLGSWAQFPDNDNVPLDPVRRSDFVAISHDHRDHFDIEFLQTLDPSSTIIVPDYEHTRLRDTLAATVPNRLLVARDRQPLDLGDGITLTPILQSVPVWDDCAFVITAGGKTIVDLNDIKLPATDIDWIARNFSVDFLFVQFSGANWHPAAYAYGAGKKTAIARRKVRTKFRAVANLVEQLNPACVVPCAGPACFLDEALFDENFAPHSIFPTQADFVEFARVAGFEERIAVMLPNDTITPRTDWRARTRSNLQSPAFTDRRRYLREYQQRRLPAIKGVLSDIDEPQRSLLEDCRAYFEPLINASPYLAERIGGALLLDLTGPSAESIIVDFTRADDAVRPYAGEECFYRIRTEARFASEIFAGRTTWEELLLSLRFEATRDPDLYSEHLTVFLRYADPAHYERFEEYERSKTNDDRFILHHDGKELCVQRACPHAGGDLSKGSVEGDDLLCPVHGWRFSLKDGTCARTGYAIAVEEIAANAVAMRSR